jgi:hypothetical protein
MAQVKGTVNGVEIVVDTYAEFLAAKAAIEADAEACAEAARIEAEAREAQCQAEADAREAQAEADAEAERLRLKALPVYAKAKASTIFWFVAASIVGMAIGQILSVWLLSTLGAKAAYISLPEYVYSQVKSVGTYGEYGLILILTCAVVMAVLVLSVGGPKKITLSTAGVALLVCISIFFFKNVLVFVGIAALAILPVPVWITALLLTVVTIFTIKWGVKKVPKA